MIEPTTSNQTRACVHAAARPMPIFHRCSKPSRIQFHSERRSGHANSRTGLCGGPVDLGAVHAHQRRAPTSRPRPSYPAVPPVPSMHVRSHCCQARKSLLTAQRLQGIPTYSIHLGLGSLRCMMHPNAGIQYRSLASKTDVPAARRARTDGRLSAFRRMGAMSQAN